MTKVSEAAHENSRPRDSGNRRKPVKNPQTRLKSSPAANSPWAIRLSAVSGTLRRGEFRVRGNYERRAFSIQRLEGSRLGTVVLWVLNGREERRGWGIRESIGCDGGKRSSPEDFRSLTALRQTQQAHVGHWCWGKRRIGAGRRTATTICCRSWTRRIPD
jgi:hypothetical protein